MNGLEIIRADDEPGIRKMTQSISRSVITVKLQFKIADFGSGPQFPAQNPKQFKPNSEIFQIVFFIKVVGWQKNEIVLWKFIHDEPGDQKMGQRWGIKRSAVNNLHNFTCKNEKGPDQKTNLNSYAQLFYHSYCFLLSDFVRTKNTRFRK